MGSALVEMAREYAVDQSMVTWYKAGGAHNPELEEWSVGRKELDLHDFRSLAF
tara:strand:- start:897 stop:1055 length:159 start_codon:yes stop_codon:yes gene_type:complete